MNCRKQTGYWSLPHQTTYEQVLGKLDADELEQIVGRFFTQHLSGNIIVTQDGKVLRGTIPADQTQGVHLLAAYRPEQGVVLMQIEVADKTNEITSAPRLLEVLNLREAVITGDAMFTQRDLCDQIVLAGGDYVFPVKDNHPVLRRAIVDVMPALVSAGHSAVQLPETATQTLNSGHGRIEH